MADMTDLNSKTFEPKYTLAEALRLEKSLNLIKELNELYEVAKTVDPDILNDVVTHSTGSDYQAAQDVLEMLLDKLRLLAESFDNSAVQSAHQKIRDELKAIK
jgi:hypothetical protein